MADGSDTSSPADLEFFFDPVCPWAWITSRWVHHVADQRDYRVRWRFISLWILNEQNVQEWYTPEYRAGHYRGQQGLRVADAIRLDGGDVGAWYTALGTALHIEGRRDESVADPSAFLGSLLADAGFDPVLAAAADDESHDAYLRADTELALGRTGRDVGTPILTFRPGADDEASFFGPVISKAPTGDDALRLWDAVETLATMSGMAELKRSNRMPLDFT
jgi:2-hydroxychromene-2-carboxylate isomerase